MIMGIGIDSVDVARFALWHTYSVKKLSRIFSSEEIEYCLASVNKSAERFAVRFAVREALFKALSYAQPDSTVPFLTLCRRTVVYKINGRPYVKILDESGSNYNSFSIHISFSHTATVATAFVIIEKTGEKK